ncbi:MAG TPA: OmpA family protein [Blastocatellia bacterium]|jgi:outer membrane protein OmpA-like peptidoglycan-associated protein
MKKLSNVKALVVLLGLVLTTPVLAGQNGQDQNGKMDQTRQNDSARRVQAPSGVKSKVTGVILRRENSDLILRDQSGAEWLVRVAGNTKIQEKKSNPFRSSKKYSSDQLVRGLFAEVEGRGDGSGVLVADKIKFADDDLRVALTVDSQVVPIENRLGDTETRLAQTEQNAQRLSGQLEELSQVANIARGGAKAAQESADRAIEGVNMTNERITTLDDYDVKKSSMINFRVGSAVLSPDAKSMLDEIATQAQTERGFVIEVRGFASSDGAENMNRQLSQRRAEAVVRYLAEKHDIPLRRIILPFGYGEALPVADNTSREGRQQNRRVEVKILVSRGLTSPVNVSRPVSENRQ